jgi:hypothetical protein
VVSSVAVEPWLVVREVTASGSVWWGPFAGIDAVIAWCEATGATVEPVVLADPGGR